MHTGRLRLFRRQLSLVSLIKLFLDPITAIGVLAASAAYFEEPFQGQYLVLALVVFSLTFPGNWPEATIKDLWRGIVGPWLTVVAILFFFGYASGYLDVFPQGLILAWVLSTPLALFIAHRIFRRALPRILAWEGSHRSAVIVGANEVGCKLAAQLAQESFLGVSLTGFFDDRQPARLADVAGAPVLGKMRELAGYVKAQGVDLIYIALPMASQPRIVQLLDDLRDTTASVYFVPDIFIFDLVQARVDDVRGIPIVAVCETPFYGVNGLLKRLFDIVAASLILLLISPVMVAIAIGVKRSSPGPVFFKQRRYGLDGQDILVYKFRSMTVCEDGEDIRQARRNDRRITPFGAFLRKTSLDELPQLLNVLSGQMSLVGPRPHAVAHNELYRKLVKGYMIRHKVKPGITGWAQVNGLRGETETVDKMQRRIQYDIDYLRHWSLLFDIMILLKTALVVVRDRNAY
jgi:putative colanic acid biosynthesis UDP-glucose lipid carrier transferase